MGGGGFLPFPATAPTCVTQLCLLKGTVTLRRGDLSSEEMNGQWIPAEHPSRRKRPWGRGGVKVEARCRRDVGKVPQLENLRHRPPDSQPGRGRFVEFGSYFCRNLFGLVNERRRWCGASGAPRRLALPNWAAEEGAGWLFGEGPRTLRCKNGGGCYRRARR